MQPGDFPRRVSGRSVLDLRARLPQKGTVTWIGLRSAPRGPVRVVAAAEAHEEHGLVGDHFRGGLDSRRQVTLIQEEHLYVVGRFLRLSDDADPEFARRNLVVRGVNLLALVGARFSVGKALLEGTDVCEPCHRMEEGFGLGGYNAMRGHGGITARVIRSGWIKVGNAVTLAGLCPSSELKNWHAIP